MQPDRLLVAVLLLAVRVPGVPAQELTERGTFKFPVYGAQLSPDGKVLAAGCAARSGEQLKLWSAVTGKEVVSLPAVANSLYSLAFSADGKRLATGGGPVQVWDVIAHREIASFKVPGDIVALNRDGTRVAAVRGRQATVWNVASGKEIASFRHHVAVYGGQAAAFSTDLGTLAVLNYQEIDLWDTATGKEKAILSEHRGGVGCIVWSADDKTLIASSTRFVWKDSKAKGDVKLWDVAKGKERATPPGPFGYVQAMAPSPDGKTLALLDSPEFHAESELKLVDLDSGRQRILRVPPGWSFRSLRFTTAGKLLVVGTSTDAVRLWEVTLPKKDVKP